jgi:hypothetical protein
LATTKITKHHENTPRRHDSLNDSSQSVVVIKVITIKMPGCCVFECKNSGRKGFRLFRIPKNIRQQKSWLMRLKLEKANNANNLRVCEASIE